jgi:hypothetical protein
MSADFRIALPIAIGVEVRSGFVRGVLSEEPSVLESAGGAGEYGDQKQVEPPGLFRQ